MKKTKMSTSRLAKQTATTKNSPKTWVRMMTTKPGPLCHRCPLKDELGPVWGEGPPDAKLIAIGMAPAAEETLQKRPFVGPAGTTLDHGFRKAGIIREQVYITNLVKCFVKPRTNVPREAIACCHPLLEQEIFNLPNANTILTLGAPPFETISAKRFTTVTNRKDTRAWLRGCPFPAGERTVIPAAHPIYMQYTGFREEPWWVEDLKKAKRWAEGGGIRVKEDFNYNPTEEDVRSYVASCIEKGRYGLDIETSEKIFEEEGDLIGRGEADIQIIGISHSIGSCIGVPPPLYPLLRPLFSCRDRPLTMFVFNAGFDCFHLRRSFEFDGVQIFDVMLALNCLYSDIRPKDLGMALSLFTDCEYSKNLAKIDPNRYNAYDTFGVLWAGLTLQQRLKEDNLENVFYHQDMPLWPVVDELRTMGTQCDVAEAERLELVCYKSLNGYEQFWQRISPAINWTQNKELLAIFLKQGMPLRYKIRVAKDKSRKRTPCLDAEVLEEYRDKYNNQTAALILLMRKLKKAADFTHIYDSDGKAHVQYDIKGQRMGRVQAKDPDLQNIPEELVIGKDLVIRPRTIIIPDDPESDVIITADFEQIEFWIYAFAAGDQPLLAVKKRGEYIYGQFFEDLLRKPFFQSGCPRTKAFKRKDVRPVDLLLAKSGPLGLIYGRGEQSLMLGFGIPAVEAKAMYNNFFNQHLAISALHTRLVQEASRDGYLRNFFGRIRRFPYVQAMRNEVLSFPGQSNAADILRRNALFPLFDGLRDFGARLLLTVHDSVAVSCPRRTVHGAVSFIRDHMESPIPEMQNFWIPAEISVGCRESSTTGKPNWGDLISYDDFCALSARSTGDVSKSA